MYSFERVTSQYIHKINEENFCAIALDLFRYQYEHNELYRRFCDAINTVPGAVNELSAIPFLPVSFFKTHKVVTGSKSIEPSMVFESSRTTGEVPAAHYVYSKDLYEAALLNGFCSFYKEPAEYAILALLPSYLERKNASLVHMAQTLMKESAHPDNGFYLNEWEKLSNTLARLEAQKQPVILLGVTFALLDFAEAFSTQLRHTIVMETGGMKGRREEWTRTRVHEFLKKQWQVKQVHSEYGMTELLSQAYSKEDGMFKTSSSMRVLVRDMYDPLEVREKGVGVLNIADLANVDSCAFIATDDIGNIHDDGRFEVLGRMDHAVLRGCSLMAV